MIVEHLFVASAAIFRRQKTGSKTLLVAGRKGDKISDPSFVLRSVSKIADSMLDLTAQFIRVEEFAFLSIWRTPLFWTPASTTIIQSHFLPALLCGRICRTKLRCPSCTTLIYSFLGFS
jgi:hypothetical protein